MHRITAGFNVALLAFQAVTGFVTFLASDRARAFPLAGILLTSFIDLIRLIVVMMLIAWFVREFWQRLITSLVPIRPIDFQEALAIVLMFGLLLGR
ncbi:MAG: hypothetical protein ABS79_04095 [Planctomycetes bacterium SCN 63-9]|nr:MAG: hypothetical protein ABS79_04095 [Planctomycetes bacterium SCN 63-9]